MGNNFVKLGGKMKFGEAISNPIMFIPNEVVASNNMIVSCCNGTINPSPLSRSIKI